MICQTYPNLDILIIDDGSTDGCKEICDEYKNDKRVRVFHTENHGLSAARNLGLNNAIGEYIYFIDSDDWIDNNLIEQAVKSIADADILCFSKYEARYSGFEALCAEINEKIKFFAWNNLYKKECFSVIRYPEGRIMEDMATTYKILYQSKVVISKNIHGYHHIYREGSLAQTHNLQNIYDYFLAVEEETSFFLSSLPFYQDNLSKQQINELNTNLLKKRAIAISRAWGWRYINHPSDSIEWKKLSMQAKTMFPYKVRRQFPFRIRGGLFLARFNNPLSFFIAYKIHVFTRKVPKKAQH